jgi:hypothetical protein
VRRLERSGFLHILLEAAYRPGVAQQPAINHGDTPQRRINSLAIEIRETATSLSPAGLR